jgi:hypothetical protein
MMTAIWIYAALKEMVERFPCCAPTVCVWGYGVWIFDSRWRLPYRWYEFQSFREGGGAVMLFGLTIMATPFRPTPEKTR